jgi:hypothetical protein
MIEISFDSLAQRHGVSKTGVTMPDGNVMEMYTWKPNELKAMAETLRAERDPQELYAFTGSTQPQVCAAAVCALSPAKVQLNVFAIEKDLILPEVPFGQVRESAGIDFQVELQGDDVLIKAGESDFVKGAPPNLKGQNYLYDHASELTLPDIPAGKNVLISGSLANFISAPVSRSLAGRSRTVYIKLGGQEQYTCVASNSEDISVGDVR